MNDLDFGTRDARGEWGPNEPMQAAPVFVLPPRPLAFLKWLPGYFLPWNVILMGIAGITWYLLTPDVETLRTLAPGWILYLLARNSIGILLFYGLFQLHFYIRKRQGEEFKYNAKWPDGKSRKFLLGSQMNENLLMTFLSGVPIMTAYEVLVLWLFASGRVPWSSFADHPLWLVGFALLVPLIHELHFYLVHRLIHTPFLFKHVHRLHHKNVNPGPFSSLSMHPVEHLMYFSGVLIHVVLPSHPLLAMYQLCFAGYGAVVGHIGFDKAVLADGKTVDTHAYNHYLHHKYFEVNYSESLIPMDRWFGTFHDGSKEADVAMRSRGAARRKQMAG